MTNNNAIYLEGWLQLKEEKKYEGFWFVLKVISNEGPIVGAELCCYNDRITTPENLHGSISLKFKNRDAMECLKIEGKKVNDCKFSVLLRTIDFNKMSWDKLEDRELHFCAYDNITRERWLYVLCDLAGSHKPPSVDLPTEHNSIRATRPRAKPSFSFKKPQIQHSTFDQGPTEDESYKSMVKMGSDFLVNPGNNRLNRRRVSDFQINYDVQGRMPSIPLRPRETITPPKSPKRSKSPKRLPIAIPIQSSWYYGKLPRRECESVLRQNIPGAFLLRDASQANSFSCSYKDDKGKLMHLLITRTENGKYKVSDKFTITFDSPIDGAEFYMQKITTDTYKPFPLSKRNNQIDRIGPILPSDTLNQSYDQQRLSQQLNPHKRSSFRDLDKNLSRSSDAIRKNNFTKILENVPEDSKKYIRMEDTAKAEEVEQETEQSNQNDFKDHGYLKLEEKQFHIDDSSQLSRSLEKDYEVMFGRSNTRKHSKNEDCKENADDGSYESMDRSKGKTYIRMEDTTKAEVCEENADDGNYESMDRSKGLCSRTDKNDDGYIVMDEANVSQKSLSISTTTQLTKVGQTEYLNQHSAEEEDDHDRYLVLKDDEDVEDQSYIQMDSNLIDEDNGYVKMTANENTDGDKGYIQMDSLNLDDEEDCYMKMTAKKDTINDEDDERYVIMK